MFSCIITFCNGNFGLFPMKNIELLTQHKQQQVTKKAQDFATRAIHHAYDARQHQGALCPPIHFSSTFTFESASHGEAMFAQEQSGHFYSRISNPSLEILEQRLANLEQAESGLSFASGMAAISATMWTLLKSGDEIIVDKTLYGCTYALLHNGLKKFGVHIIHIDLSTCDELEKHITSKTKLIYYETPANPNMRLVDIAKVSMIAKQHNIISVVDNTYASPFITRPITLGADIVVHSASKYLGGHGDLIAGMLAGSKALVDQIRLEGLKDMTGACMSPFTAMLIMRGIKTLALRMKQHSDSALDIAEFLQRHPKVKKVYYPGLVSFSQHELACRQMDVFGGMIAFYLIGGMSAGKSLINNLKLIQCAVSLGDAETLIQHPASMTHSAYSDDERQKHGISDDLIRLSVGLESSQDLIRDLSEGLARIA